MIIKFLGTSAGWPLPRLGCHCPICTSTDPRDKRTRPSILINNSTLIDCSPDFYWQPTSRGVASCAPPGCLLEAIILTHAHFDHIFGLWDATKMYNTEKIKLFATKPTIQYLQDLFGIYLSAFEVYQIKELIPFEVNKLKVVLFPVEHGTTSTYGVKIKGDKLLSYVPDFNRILPSYKKLIKDMDVLILDGSSLGKIGKTHGHISIEEGIEIGKELKAKKVYFTHIGHKTGKHENLEDFVKVNGGPNFNIGYDGLEINC